MILMIIIIKFNVNVIEQKSPTISARGPLGHKHCVIVMDPVLWN